VVGEAMVAIVLAAAVLEQFSADTVGDLDAAWAAYGARLADRLSPIPS
jgi:hypothetical protein